MLRRLKRLQAREEAAKAGAQALEARALALRQEAAQQVAGMLASSIAPEESGTFAAASGGLLGIGQRWFRCQHCGPA